MKNIHGKNKTIAKQSKKNLLPTTNRTERNVYGKIARLRDKTRKHEKAMRSGGVLKYVRLMFGVEADKDSETESRIWDGGCRMLFQRRVSAVQPPGVTTKNKARLQ